MKHGFVRAAAACPLLKVADPAFNADNMIKTILEQAAVGTELLVFPELSLCGYTCGDLLLDRTLLKGCLSALERIAKATAGLRILVFVGLPLEFQNKLYNCAAAISGGRVLGFVPKSHVPNYGEFYEQRHFSPAPEGVFYLQSGSFADTPFSKRLLFQAKNAAACVACEICEDLWTDVSPSSEHARAGANIVVNLSASNETVGKREYRRTLVSAQSGKAVCGYIYCDAGLGESTSDMVFAGNHMIYENGVCLAEEKPFSGEVCAAEIDADFLCRERRRLTTFCAVSAEANYLRIEWELTEGDVALREIDPLPFVPRERDAFSERARLILNIQAHALAKRMSHTSSKTAVIGVSGGLDSALAFLVTVRAFDLLNKPHADIIAVTMPGFGTTADTKHNSLALMEELGATGKTVPISDTVLKHFQDIGHDPALPDATYENAQARYRTMILMDLANQTGGLVIGTGDLSELALGWCTYNGDHMSNYAVNCSVPKTLVKYLVRAEGERIGGKTREILTNILNTEISPELLPPDREGKIAQKTEDLVGPYELHDFYLYRFLRRGDSPAKTLYLAERAFKGKYDRNTLKKWLLNFYRRFFSQQFKRNCVPDGVKVGSVSLSPRADWRMPSDASAALWIEEAENL